MAVVLSKLFMRTISQNPNENQTGISLWSLEEVEKAEKKRKEKEAQIHEGTLNQNEEQFDDGGLDDNALMDLDL
jgi:DNA excision repair protein ERCC-2